VECSRLQKAKLLRDIFASSDAEGLHNAYVEAFPSSSHSMEEVESAFNRYFVGPEAPYAPPYASLYLDNSGLLMSETTQRVKEIYTLIGLTNPHEGSVPDDFLGFELDAYYQLLFLEEVKQIDYLKQMRCYFLLEHMATWIFPFIEASRTKAKEPSPAIQQVLDMLEAFLKTEIIHEGGDHERF
jgi:TorA maturation chaperone TorD